MRIDILTLFPNICLGAFSESIMKRARDKSLASIEVHNIRDWTHDKHHITDDTPYGGGSGMVLKPEPIFEAVEHLRNSFPADPAKCLTILMTPAGERLTHALALSYATTLEHMIVVCGHYEGIDQRVIDHLIGAEISIGDYVLTNGAIAAAVLADAVVRLIPGVLGDECSAADDSFAEGLLEYPQYTRPVEYRGWRVPEILLSGNHAAIARWRKEQALAKTRRSRPDLLGPVP